MSSDKLNQTVRAAGFAMACDESAAPPAAKPFAMPGLLPQPREGQTARSNALVPTPLAKPVASAWGLGGFSFWKTA